MNDRFQWAGPEEIVFGAGTLARLPEWTGELGTRALLVAGSSGRAGRAIALLEAAGVAVTEFTVAGEPGIVAVEEGAALGRARRCQWVLAFGGGSALDAGKAIAALLTNTGSPLDYLEVIGAGRALENAAAPVVAVPTTAGTGSEATRNAVLHSPQHGVKASLRHRSLLPRLALVDPELALTLPPNLTAATGMDALTQLLEAFVCTRAQPMTDALCAQGIAKAARALPRAVAEGGDLEARSDLALAALYSGLALANAGLGAVHGFAAPLGGRHDLSHGAVCAALLPAVWEVNLNAVKARGSAATLDRFRRAAAWLTGDASAKPEAAVDWLRDLSRQLGIASLSALGVTPSDWDDLIPLAKRASSMKPNPVPLTAAELRACLEKASV